MSDSIKYDLNKTQDEEMELPCIKCSGKTAHKALVSVDMRGSHRSRCGNFFDWSEDHQIVQCMGCKSLSYRIACSNSEDYHQAHDNEVVYDVVEKLFPPRLEGIKGLGDEVHYLPAKVRLIYKETLLALSVQSPVLAGVGMRALLETVCKERNGIVAN